MYHCVMYWYYYCCLADATVVTSLFLSGMDCRTEENQ
jgi:hypothetical protein